MAIFNQLRPLLRISNQLERIAVCLEFMVRQQARKDGVLWNGGRRVPHDGVDPELFHTVPAEIKALIDHEQERFAARGEPDDLQ